MNGATMTRLIDEELSHIPRADRGSTQNELRMLYNYYRRRHLALSPTIPARNALFAAIKALEAEPFSPSFEWEYFRPGGGSSRLVKNGHPDGNGHSRGVNVGD